MKMPAEVPPGTPPHWGAYVTVSDVDAMVAKAISLGGGVLAGPRDIPSVERLAVLRDPQGASIAHEPRWVTHRHRRRYCRRPGRVAAST